MKSKKRQLEKLHREGKITKSEMQRRYEQSLASRGDLQLIHPRNFQKGKVPLKRTDKKLYDYALSILDPREHMSSIPDLCSIVTAKRRLITGFTCSPTSIGALEFEVRPYAPWHSTTPAYVSMVAGSAIFGGTTYYSGGPSGSNFDCEGTSSISAERFRVIGLEVEVKFIGGTLQNSGEAACMQVPPCISSVPTITFDIISLYPTGYTGAAMNGVSTVFLPPGEEAVTKWYEYGTTTISETGYLHFIFSGIDYAGTYPASEARFRVRITQTFEFTGLSADLIGSGSVHAGSSAGMRIAQQVAAKVNKGNAAHGTHDSAQSEHGSLGALMRLSNGVSDYSSKAASWIWNNKEAILSNAVEGATLLAAAV